MIFGRKLPKLAETGDSQRTLKILEKGGFGPEKYNESYQSFVAKNQRQEGLDIIKTAHEKFPNDPVSCNHRFQRWNISKNVIIFRNKSDILQYKPLLKHKCIQPVKPIYR